jgi:serine protease Do
MEDPTPPNLPKNSPVPADRRDVFGPDHPRVRFLALALLLIMSIGFGFLGGWLGAKHQADSGATIETQQVILKSQGDLLSKIAEDHGKSVVSITTTAEVEDFFGPIEQEGAGTGIILTEEGLIITNRHVVPAGTSKVTVTLADGTEYKDVEIIGRTGSNDSLDVAFLKITDTKGKKLVPATLGDSAKMKVGDPVVAIGNALGYFQNTVTSGIISGYGRSIQASSSDGSGVDSLENLFQTDAAINAGNSGGPLVNLNGEVVGINTAIAAGDAQNIGFAIPINDVVGLIKSVKEKGVLERPFLGVMYIPLTNDTAEAYGLSVNRGAYIAPPGVSGGDSIIDGGPADKAGIKAGDIITKINDVAIDQHNSLSALVNKYAVGDKITLTIFRDGKEQKVGVTLSAAPTT